MNTQKNFNNYILKNPPKVETGSRLAAAIIL
jgi:hypothetical protein